MKHIAAWPRLPHCRPTCIWFKKTNSPYQGTDITDYGVLGLAPCHTSRTECWSSVLLVWGRHPGLILKPPKMRWHARYAKHCLKSLCLRAPGLYFGNFWAWSSRCLLPVDVLCRTQCKWGSKDSNAPDRWQAIPALTRWNIQTEGPALRPAIRPEGRRSAERSPVRKVYLQPPSFKPLADKANSRAWSGAGSCQQGKRFRCTCRCTVPGAPLPGQCLPNGPWRGWCLQCKPLPGCLALGHRRRDERWNTKNQCLVIWWWCNVLLVLLVMMMTMVVVVVMMMMMMMMTLSLSLSFGGCCAFALIGLQLWFWACLILIWMMPLVVVWLLFALEHPSRAFAVIGVWWSFKNVWSWSRTR